MVQHDSDPSFATRPNGTVLRAGRRIPALDGLRGIAILLVMAVHLYIAEVVPPHGFLVHAATTLLSWAWSGVDLFFVLSGFLISGILLDTREVTNRTSFFYGRRALRILPLYYTFVLSCIAASVVLPHSFLRRDFWPSAAGWLSYLFYFQNWWMPIAEPGRVNFLGPFWSLAVEEQFYLVWPACVWFLSPKSLVKICVAGILVAFLWRWFCLTHFSPALDTFIYMNTFTRMDGLLAGALCAAAVRDRILLARIRRLLTLTCPLALFGLGYLMFLGQHTWNSRDTLLYSYSLLAVVWASLVLFVYERHNRGGVLDRVLRSRLLAFFGRYSYGIYVFQGISQFLLLRLWHINLLAAVLVWLINSVGLAMLSYHLLEAPFRRFKESLVPRWSRNEISMPGTAPPG